MVVAHAWARVASGVPGYEIETTYSSSLPEQGRAEGAGTKTKRHVIARCERRLTGLQKVMDVTGRVAGIHKTIIHQRQFGG